MSAEGLRVYSKVTWGVNLSPADAQKHRDAWLRAYPGVASWHAQANRSRPKETRSRYGRRRQLWESAPTTEALNSPVQADESDGIKVAFALLWKRRKECPGAAPVLLVHDEIVVSCPAEGADQIRVWLEEAMLDGMSPILEPVRCRVDAKTQPSWGG